MIITHRINTLEELKCLGPDEPIEFDVRDSNGKCIVQHDAFQEGIDFEEFLHAVGNRFLIVNVKAEGIETKVLSLLKLFGCNDFFLLDCSFPKIVELCKQGENRIAVRYSEYESIHTVLLLANKVKWVWVDCFSFLCLSKNDVEKFHQANMKVCLVSPDLQKRPHEVNDYIKELLSKDIKIDAVCTKRANRSAWQSYFDRIL